MKTCLGVYFFSGHSVVGNSILSLLTIFTRICVLKMIVGDSSNVLVFSFKDMQSTLPSIY